MMNDVTAAEAVLCDPDCLRCLHKNLNAVCVAVFFRSEDGWRLSSYQGEKPSSAAEVEFTAMLNQGLPEALAKESEGLILNTPEAIEKKLPSMKNLLNGQALIAAPVQRGRLLGLRLAWRSSKEPFSAAELEEIQCYGDCPGDCCR